MREIDVNSKASLHQPTKITVVLISLQNLTIDKEKLSETLIASSNPPGQNMKTSAS